MPSNQESLCPSVAEMWSSATLGGSVHLQYTTTVVTEWSLWSLKLLSTRAGVFFSHKRLHLQWLQPWLFCRSKAGSLPVLLHTLEWSRPAPLSHRDTVSFAFVELLNNAYVCPGSWFREKLLHPKDSSLLLFSYVGKNFPALVLLDGLQLLRRKPSFQSIRLLYWQISYWWCLCTFRKFLSFFKIKVFISLPW